MEYIDNIIIWLSLLINDYFHISFINYYVLFFIFIIPIFIYFTSKKRGIEVYRSDLSFVSKQGWLSKMITHLPNMVMFGVFVLGILALAKPYWGGNEVTKKGQGSQIVITIDRSVSMSEEIRNSGGITKNEATAKLISNLVNRNLKDMFGFVVYSNSGIISMPITSNRDTIDSTVKMIPGPGLAKTNVYGALKSSIDLFSSAPYISDRAIIIFTDGASRMDAKSKEIIKDYLLRENISLYWVYINDNRGISIKKPTDVVLKEVNNIPAVIEFRDYLMTLKSKVKIFEATNMAELEAAVEDISTQERHLMVWKEQSQAIDLSGQLSFICSVLAASLLIFTLLGW